MRYLAVLIIVAGCGATDLEKASNKANEGGDRPLVIMATAQWCGPCKRFKKYVLPSPQVQEALEDVEFVMLDEATSKGSLGRLGVRSYPTFIVVRDNKPVAALTGAAGSSRFIDFLTWGTPNWFTRESLSRALEKQPTTRTRLYAARWFALNGDLARAGEMYKTTLSGLAAEEQSRRPTIAWEALLIKSLGADGRVFSLRVSDFVTQYPSSHQVLPAVGLALVSTGLSPEEKRDLARRTLALLNSNAESLNEFTYALLAAKLPDIALAAAVRQVELTPKNANAYDTLGEAHNYLQQRDAAVAAADKAIALESSSDSKSAYQANRGRFAAGGPAKGVAATRARAVKTLARFKIRQQ